MTTNVIQPANTDTLAHRADYRPYARHNTGAWTILVERGHYAPPEGWQITSVDQEPLGTLVRIRREGNDD